MGNRRLVRHEAKHARDTVEPPIRTINLIHRQFIRYYFMREIVSHCHCTKAVNEKEWPYATVLRAKILLIKD